MKDLKAQEERTQFVSTLYSYDFLTLENFNKHFDLQTFVMVLTVLGVLVNFFCIRYKDAAKNYRKSRKPFFAPTGPWMFFNLILLHQMCVSASTMVALLRPDVKIIVVLTGFTILTTMNALFSLSYFVFAEMSMSFLANFFSLFAGMYFSYLMAEVFYLAFNASLVSLALMLYLVAVTGRQWYVIEFANAAKILNMNGIAGSLGPTGQGKGKKHPRLPPRAEAQ